MRYPCYRKQYKIQGCRTTMLLLQVHFVRNKWSLHVNFQEFLTDLNQIWNLSNDLSEILKKLQKFRWNLYSRSCWLIHVYRQTDRQEELKTLMDSIRYYANAPKNTKYSSSTRIKTWHKTRQRKHNVHQPIKSEQFKWWFGISPQVNPYPANVDNMASSYQC